MQNHCLFLQLNYNVFSLTDFFVVKLFIFNFKHYERNGSDCCNQTKNRLEH